MRIIRDRAADIQRRSRAAVTTIHGGDGALQSRGVCTPREGLGPPADGLSANQLHKSEIREPHTTVGANEYIGRLDVTVDHASLVGISQSLGQLNGPTVRFVGSNPARGASKQFLVKGSGPTVG